MNEVDKTNLKLDEAGLASAFDEHRERLWRLARFRMDPRLLVRLSPDDILQEAYLDAAQRLPHFEAFANKITDQSVPEADQVNAEASGASKNNLEDEPESVPEFLPELPEGSESDESGGNPGAVFFWLRWIVKQTLINMHRRHLGAAKRDAYRETSLNANWGGDGLNTGSAMSFAISGIFPGEIRDERGRKLTISSPSQKLMRQEDAIKLQQAIEGMDETDREVLALRHFEELTNSEVAIALDITAKNASIRYVRALKRLKGLVDQGSGGDR